MIFNSYYNNCNENHLVSRIFAFYFGYFIGILTTSVSNVCKKINYTINITKSRIKKALLKIFTCLSIVSKKFIKIKKTNELE